MKKRTPPTRTYRVVLDGELAGFELVMRGMSAADLIAITSPNSNISNAEAIDLAIKHIVTSNFDVADHHELDWWIVLEILNAWTEAIREAAFPPETAMP